MSFALEELTRRAANNNLCIEEQGANPPGPCVLTYRDDNEDIDTLHYIRDELELGTVYPGSGKRSDGKSGTWVAYDEEAILVLIDLMPYLKQAPRCKEITKRICWAGNMLGEWRRKHPGWKKQCV